MNQPPSGASHRRRCWHRTSARRTDSTRSRRPRAAGKAGRGRPSMQRQQPDRDRLEHRHGEQEHHHRAVHREDLVVLSSRQEGRCRERRAATGSSAPARRPAPGTSCRCRYSSAPMKVLLTSVSRRQALGRFPGRGQAGRGRAAAAEDGQPAPRRYAVISGSPDSRPARSGSRRPDRWYEGIRLPGLIRCDPAIQPESGPTPFGSVAAPRDRRDPTWVRSGPISPPPWRHLPPTADTVAGPAAGGQEGITAARQFGRRPGSAAGRRCASIQASNSSGGWATTQNDISAC